MIRDLAKTFYYGYVVLVSCVIASFSYGIFYTVAVFFKPLQEEFGWSATLVASVHSVHLLVFVASSFLVGWSTDRIGPRLTMGWGGTLIGIGFVCCNFINSIWHLYIFYSVASLGAGIIWSLPLTTIQRWFIKGRGLTLGIVASGVGFGTLFFAPAANHFIINYGWRKSYIILGMSTWVILMAAAFFIRKNPEDVGAKPYGFEAIRNKTSSVDSKVWRDGEWTFREAVRTRTIWLLCILYFCTVLPMEMAMVHIVAFAINLGISKAASAGALGLIGGASICGRIIMAWSAEKLGWKVALTICLSGCTVMFLWLTGVKSLWMIYVFAIIYGFFYGGKTPLIPGLIGLCFPGKSMATIIGMVHGLSLIGGALGPLVGGIAYDATSSYTAAFAMGAFFWAAGAVLLLYVKLPQKQKEVAVGLSIAKLTS